MFKRKIFVWLIVLCALLLATAFAAASCITRSESDASAQEWFFSNLFLMRTQVYGEMEVATEWQEITLRRSIQADNCARYLALETTDWQKWEPINRQEYTSDQGLIKNADGETIKIEGQMISKDGKVFQMLMKSSIDGGPTFFSGVNLDTERDKQLVRMRIKSSKQFKVVRVLWVCSRF